MVQVSHPQHRALGAQAHSQARPGLCPVNERPSPHLLCVWSQAAKALGQQGPTLWTETRNSSQQRDIGKMGAHLRGQGGKNQGSKHPPLSSEVPEQMGRGRGFCRAKDGALWKVCLSGRAGRTTGC